MSDRFRSAQGNRDGVLAVAIVAVFLIPATAGAQAPENAATRTSCTTSRTFSMRVEFADLHRAQKVLGHKDRWARQLSDFDMGARQRRAEPTTLKEFRVASPDDYAVGQTLTVEQFTAGDKVKITGDMREKKYWRHSQYPGGLKSISQEKLLATRPERVIEYAVKGMLPHNSLGARLLKRLKVYAGPDHPHQSQVNAGTSKKSAPAKSEASKSAASA